MSPHPGGLLLDTCTFLWLAWDSPRLSATARAAFQRPDAEVWLSAVSAWEISVKHGLGKLPLPESPDRLVPRLREAMGLRSLPVSEEAALGVARLPALHRDPFDRMLVSQAIAHGLTLLSSDELVRAYPARTMW